MVSLPQFEIISEARAAIWRNRTPSQRLHITMGLNRAMKWQQMAEIQREYPEWTEEEVHWEYVRRKINEPSEWYPSPEQADTPHHV